MNLLLSLIWLTVSLCMLGSSALAGDNPAEVLAQLQKARKLFSQYKYEKAEYELKKILKIDKTCMDAYQILANIYVREGSIHGRTRAEDLMRDAIDAMPENVAFHISLAEIFVKQGFVENARRYLERTSERNPDNPDVLYMLANIYKANARRFQNEISTMTYSLFDENYFRQLQEFGSGPDYSNRERVNYEAESGASPVSNMLGYGSELFHNSGKHSPAVLARLEHDAASPILHDPGKAKDQFLKAEDIYAKLQALVPHYKDVDREQAILAYYAKDWQKMVEYARRFIQVKPDDRNGYLLSGLGYQRMGKYKEASQAFEKFREYLLPIEREYIDHFDPFLSEMQQDLIATLEEPKKVKYREKFWYSRDPLFMTEYNERKLEHCARIAEAHILFSEPKYNLEGWKSDRGVIWVRYGPPNEILKNFNANAAGVSLRMMGPRRLDSEVFQEFWYYDKYTFVFCASIQGGGLVKFFDSREISFSHIANQIQKKHPDDFKMEAPGELIDFPRCTGTFRGDKGKTRLHIYYGIPLTALQYEKQGVKYISEFDHGIFLFDGAWNPIVKKMWLSRHESVVSIDSGNTEIAVIQTRIELRPGTYNLAIEFRDDSSGNVGSSRNRME